MKTVLTILEVSARVFWPSALALSFSIRASMVIPTKGLGTARKDTMQKCL